MKKLLIGLAVLIVLVVAAIIAVPFFIPVDTYKAQLVARVKDATGRDLRIDGPVSFSLLPSLALEANDVSFSNPPGAASKEMAKLAKLQVKLKLVPLLHRDVEIDQLVLVDPVIALEVDKQGRPNWQFGAAEAKPAAPAPGKPAAGTPAPPSSSGGNGLAELRLDDVRLVNGRISYLDQRTGAKDELDKIAMKLSLPGLDQPFTAEGSAVWKNEPVTLSLSLANPRAFEEGKSSAIALKLAAKPVTFAFKGNAAGAAPVKLDGAVDLQVPSVRALAAWAGSPITMPGTGFGPLAISGKVSVAGSKYGFSDAALSLDAIKGKGEFAYDGGGARPALKGKLALETLDLNPYLPPEKANKAGAGGGSAGGGSGSPAGTGRASGWSDDPIDLSPLKSADADFDLSAGSIRYQKIQIGNSALSLHLKDGRLQADLTQLALYQGAGKGKVVLDGAAAAPAIEADFNLDKVQIEPLLRDVMDLDRLSGVGHFAIAVTGHGKSQREIIGTLNGKGDLNLGNGTIKGMNLVSMVKNVTAAFDSSAATAQQTDFTSLSATYTIANGVLRNNDLQLKSAEIPMTGAGTVDLPKRSVDYKVTPKVAGLVAVPVIIKGPWDHLSYQPDLAGIVGDPGKLLQDPAKLLQQGAQGAGSTAKSVPGAVDSVIKGILGR